MSYGKKTSHPTNTYECGDVLEIKVPFPPPKKVKVRPKAANFLFIFYAHNSSAYQFLVHESNIANIHKNMIMESRNASFFEDIFSCKSKEDPGSSKHKLEAINENSEVEPKHSKRARIEKSYGTNFLMYMLERETQTYKEAVNSTKGLMWKEVIRSEIDSILQNHTWELVDLSLGCKPLSSKWVCKRKRKVDGSIDKYKARIVIKSYKQNEDLDYFDTYSLVTIINFIRMVLAIFALRNLKVHQMDVKLLRPFCMYTNL